MKSIPNVGRGRKALTISIFVHCLLLIGVGWLGGNLLKTAQTPVVIEVELINDVAAPESAGALPAASPASIVARTFADGTSVAARPAAVAEVTEEMVAEGVSTSTATDSGGSGVVAASAPAAGAAPTPGGSGGGGPRNIAAPRLLSKNEPIYPEEARQSGAEGIVTVRIEIRENGQPGDISVVRSSGRAAFDEAAIKAIRSWRFVPAQEVESGRPVRCYTTISVVFRLKT